MTNQIPEIIIAVWVLWPVQKCSTVTVFSLCMPAQSSLHNAQVHPGRSKAWSHSDRLQQESLSLTQVAPISQQVPQVVHGLLIAWVKPVEIIINYFIKYK